MDATVQKHFNNSEDASREERGRSSLEDAIESQKSEQAPHGVPDKKVENLGSVLTNALSRTISRSSFVDPGPPPDGGFNAWTQAIMGHLIVFNTWGYINSFGVFQIYYVTALHHPPSDISWVGSVQIFLLFFIGTFSGRATDYGLYRHIVIAGSIFELLGIFMTSLSTKYWQLFLAQGICTGLGNGLLFCPTVSMVSTYFGRNKSLAISITASGTATGGIVFPSIVQHLLPKIGFGWTVRVVGFVMLAVQVVALTFSKSRLPPRKSGPIVEWSAFRELPYCLFAIGMFLNFWGLYFAFYYIGSFGRDIIGISQTDSVNNLLILNGVGLFGRIIPGYLADHHFGPLNTLIPIVFVSALLLYCWAAISTRSGLIGFDVIYGLTAAAMQSLFPATLSSLTADLAKTGVRMGMIFSVVSFACLTGPPLAGALVQRLDGGYLYAQMFAGSVMMAGCATLLACRVARKGWSVEKV